MQLLVSFQLLSRTTLKFVTEESTCYTEARDFGSLSVLAFNLLYISFMQRSIFLIRALADFFLLYFFNYIYFLL